MTCKDAINSDTSSDDKKVYLLNEIKLFFKNNPTPGTERTQSQTLERIRINSKFLRTMRKEFKNG